MTNAPWFSKFNYTCEGCGCLVMAMAAEAVADDTLPYYTTN